MKIATVGLDLAKTVFQLHGVDADGRSRGPPSVATGGGDQSFSPGSPPCLVGMEACAGAHLLGAALTAWAMRFGSCRRRMSRRTCGGRRTTGGCRGDLRGGHAALDAVRADQERRAAGDAAGPSGTRLVGAAAHESDQRPAGASGGIRCGGAEGRAAWAETGFDAARLARPSACRTSRFPCCCGLARRCQALEAETAELEREMRHRSTCRTRRAAPAESSGRRPDHGDRAEPPPSPMPTSFPFGPRVRGVARSGADDKARPAVMSGSAASPRWAMPICADCWFIGAQAVLQASRPQTGPRDAMARRLLREKPRKVVAVALANKTARIVWALLARGEAYRLAA